jgi:hypothetical protein
LAVVAGCEEGSVSAARLIPWILHELIEYIAGVFLILAPFLFFGEGQGVGEGLDTAAFPLFIAVGVVLVALQLLSHGKASVAELLPMRVHATLDYLVAIFLILSPFLFGLTAESEPQAALLVPILLGVAHLVITLLTRFPLEQPAAEPGAAAAGAGSSSSQAGAEREAPGGAEAGGAGSSDASGADRVRPDDGGGDGVGDGG